MKVYSVIYLWRGDRHQMVMNYDKATAESIVRELKAAHWQAWLEEVQCPTK